MKHQTGEIRLGRIPLALLGGALLAITSPAALAIDPCEELRRDCMDYCRYQNPGMDHRDCKRECRERVSKCRAGGRQMPGSFGRSSEQPDYTGMPDVKDYSAGPGMMPGAPGQAMPPAGAGGYGYPGGQYPQARYPVQGGQPAAPRAAAPQGAAPIPDQGAPAAPGEAAQPPAPTAQAPAATPQTPGAAPAPRRPAYPQGYGGYPPAAPYGMYPPRPYGGGGMYPPYGRPY
jgi:hypothetical protein